MDLRRLSMVLMLVASEASAEHERTQSILGLESAYDVAEGLPSHFILSFQDQHIWRQSNELEAAQFHLRYRLFIDAERRDTFDQPGYNNIEKIIAYAEKPVGAFKFSLGLQEITWGENLVLPILDVVNPRNLDFVRGFYDADAKQSSPMLLSEWRSGEWEAQLIAVPLPVKSRQPELIGDFGIADERRYQAGQDAEYGGRVGWLHEGFDSRLYYFKHHPREPSYQFLAYAGANDAIISEEMVETSGMSLSYAGYSWLIRGDLASHDNFPATSLAPVIERTRLNQSILGLSWTTDDQQNFGIELHTDLWETLPEAYSAGAWLEKNRSQRLLNWLGTTANLSFFKALLEPQLVYLRGIDSDDQLLRLILLTHLSDSINLGTEYQKTHAQTSSPKLLLNKKESLGLRISLTW